MKYLESIKLVQFFLIDKEDVPLREITGVFGPNASGKSSLIDAVQIAMFGANSRFIALNAQADERSTTRTIRSYCLGMQDENRRARDNATTYITLVWRDSRTNEPISMGVCLYASADTEGHEVRGRYILPGVELSLNDHLEVVDNQERPQAWETFRIQLAERSKVTGEPPLYADSEKYIRAALFALRGSGGQPSFDAFKSAFRFALKMRFDKSVDSIVRNDVLEARPTNVQKFREVTESFRRLAKMVADVKEKILDGEKVESEFIKATQASSRSATWGGLAHRVGYEKCVAAMNVAMEEREVAEESLGKLRGEFEKASGEYENAVGKEKLNRELKMAHSAYQEHGALSLEITRATETESKKSRELRASVNVILNTLNKASVSPYLQDISGQIGTVAKSINAALPNLTDLDNEELTLLLKPVFKEVARARSELFKSGMRVSGELKEAEGALELSKSALDRAKDGRALLSREAERLMLELRNNGLHPTPVCDLVKIKDPAWQPVIEAYLGRNVEALLIEAHEESAAFGLYRGLTGPRAIYGAKIVAANKQGEISAAPGSVAELIEGDHPAAVSYLRRQFGSTVRAITDAEAMAGQRTLTQDGMITKSGEYERIELPHKAKLKIGGGDDSQKRALEKEIVRLGQQVLTLTKQYDEISTLTDELSLISDEPNVMTAVIGAYDEIHAARSAVGSLSKKLSETADAEYVQLGELESEWGKKALALKERVDTLTGEIGKSTEKLAQATRQETLARTLCDQTANAVDAAIAHPEYDRDFSFRQWDLLMEKYDDRYDEMLAECANHEADSKKAMYNAIARGASELGKFREKYREQGPVNSDDWRKGLEWMSELLNRLRDTELSEFDAQMQDAFKASQETFRADVAIALSNNIDHLNSSMSRLNHVLSTCPVFSNGERYRFQRTVRPQLKRLLKFVQDIAAYGPTDDLLGGAGEMPEEFRDLLNEKTMPGAAGVQSPLDDYREFFEFDIDILREDSETKVPSVVGSLSKRLGTGSGGEHRAPLYVIAGAALASAYRLDSGSTDGIRLILLDEAFNKMDTANIIATMRYLEQLGLQVFMASPGDNLGTLTAFLHRYYDILRDVDNGVILMQGHDVSEIDREMFRSDLAEFNDELVAQELAVIRGSKLAPEAEPA